LPYWFQRILFCIFPIGSYVKTMSAGGGHLGWNLEFPISKRFTSLVQDHPFLWMVIYKIFVFGTDRKSNMAARAHNVFWMVEILKIFLLEGKRFTSLVQDHPMIIPAKSQFNWLGGFWQEDFLNFSQWEHIMDPGSQFTFSLRLCDRK
jgi:hypothetical protein